MSSKRVLILSLACGLLASVAGSQPIFLTGEERVDAANSRPFAPQVALDRRGRGVVVWPEELGGLAARFLDAAGDPEGEAVLLWPNDPIPVPFRGRVRVQLDPAVVDVANNEILVVWTEELLEVRVEIFFQHETVIDRDVVGQRFTRDGKRVGRRFRLSVDEDGLGLQSQPSLVRLGDRSLLAIWRDVESVETEIGGIYARPLDGKGRPVGKVFRIDHGGGKDPSRPAAAAGPEGELIVAWDACCDASGGEAVYARLYDSEGEALGNPFRLNEENTGRQRRPTAVATADGAFLVAWEQPTGLPGPVIAEQKVYGQVIGIDGAFLGDRRQLSEGIGWGHFYPQLAAAGRSLLLVWWEWRGDFPWAIAGVELDATGAAVGEGFQISDSRTRRQASMAATRDGDYLVSWVGVLGRSGLGVATRFTSTDSLAELCDRNDPLATRSPAFAQSCAD